MTTAVLSVGSNLGDRVSHLRQALVALGDRVTAVSPVYQSPPWGDPDQPDYLNAVIIATDRLVDPAGWLRIAQSAERAAGRIRDPERRFGPRTLDVDVIAIYSPDGTPVTCAAPDLTVPHPRAHLRAFVLRPWWDLHPTAELPGHGDIGHLLTLREVRADAAALRRHPEVVLR